ncbi:MAG: SUMF1/EgtB/PvdO family nonheme iron enzyme [Planctomycetes bacterium]|nr:SUMF1/EgtB/PvdO family nonheme iron enzyme [Planctomycetota bacterium]
MKNRMTGNGYFPALLLVALALWGWGCTTNAPTAGNRSSPSTTGKLIITSEPPVLAVTVTGPKYWRASTTRMELAGLAPGEYRLQSAPLDEFAPTETTVTVRAGETATVHLTPQVNPAWKPSTPPAVPAAPATGARLPAGFSAVGTATDPASGLPMRIRCDKIAYELVLIPAGEFTMGSPDGEGMDEEHPQHRVHLDAYYLGVTEVSNGQFRQFRPEYNSCDFDGKTLNADNQPVVEVTWKDAESFCVWAGLVLPTEAQWEKAARGGDGRKFPWGPLWPPPRGSGNYQDATTERTLVGFSGIPNYDDGYAVTSPVGTFGTDAPYGTRDLSGNVSEYCADRYADKYSGRAPERNPTGPASGPDRVARGASWYSNDLVDIRVAHRVKVAETTQDSGTGFRGALVVSR